MDDTKGKALGLIETLGFIGLVEATDAAVKAAEVDAVEYEQSTGAMVIVKLRGSVGAVKAAVEAGALAAQRVGKLIGTDVIPNPDSSIDSKLAPLAMDNDVLLLEISGDPAELRRLKLLEEKGLDGLNDGDLRFIARRIRNLPLSKAEIRNAGRSKLIRALSSKEIRIVNKVS